MSVITVCVINQTVHVMILVSLNGRSWLWRFWRWDNRQTVTIFSNHVGLLLNMLLDNRKRKHRKTAQKLLAKLFHQSNKMTQNSLATQCIGIYEYARSAGHEKKTFSNAVPIFLSLNFTLVFSMKFNPKQTLFSTSTRHRLYATF